MTDRPIIARVRRWRELGPEGRLRLSADLISLGGKLREAAEDTTAQGESSLPHIEDLIRGLLDVAEAFGRTDAPFMVVDGFAVMAHGRADATGNILGVAVHLPFEDRDQTRPVLEELADGPIEERGDPQWGKRLITLLASRLDLEVFFTHGQPLYRRAFERRVAIEVQGQPVPFISPEDLILCKLVNTRKRRANDLQDAFAVAQIQGDNLDLSYLQEHCAPHRVCHRVEEIAQIIEETNPAVEDEGEDED